MPVSDPSSGCLRQAVDPVLTLNQKKTVDTAYNSCMGINQAPAPIASQSFAPAPVSLKTSRYASEGITYPISSEHSTWVIIVSIVAIIIALALVKK
jgi:hypothetical protein